MTETQTTPPAAPKTVKKPAAKKAATPPPAEKKTETKANGPQAVTLPSLSKGWAWQVKAIGPTGEEVLVVGDRNQPTGKVQVKVHIPEREDVSKTADSLSDGLKFAQKTAKTVEGIRKQREAITQAERDLEAGLA